MKIDKLKQQAREHELAEEWSEALALYRRAVEALEEAEEPDIALLNRMADLQVRSGNLEGALSSYEEAIELYLEADLPNNAIAICRKMIRNAPGRPEIFRRMGEIRARQGFVVDARQNYLTYAEMMEAEGEREKALEGLNELVTILPDDAETRIFLGEQLIANEQEDDGLPHLLHAWKVLSRAGHEERAAELEERIRSVDPGARFPDLDAEEPDSADVGAEPEGDDFGLSGFETTDLGAADPQPGSGEPPAEVGLTDEFGEDFGLAEEAAELEEDREPSEIEGSADEEPAFDEIRVDDAPASDESEVPESTEPLPLLEPGASGDGEIDPAFDSVLVDDQDPLGRIRARIAEDPDDPDHHEALIEHAYRTDDRTLLLGAFVGLASALDRSGSDEQARSIWEQVLQLDPANATARKALGRDAPTLEESASDDSDLGEEPKDEGPGSVEGFDDLMPSDEEEPVAPPPPSGDRPAASGDSFVDLGAMILDDDEVGTTRWVAPGHVPSGDEGMDFAGMLSDFKDKVARNLDHEDSQSRYDLGAAYKEMGLTDEAIAMFQAALRAHPGHLPSIEMLGQCFLEKGEPAMAVRVLNRALAVEWPVEDDLLGIYYYLGEAHERTGNPGDAREFYEKVFALDINFKDVTDRLRSLIT